MKTVLLATTIAALAAAMNLSPASAAEPQSGSPAATGTSHYEWQYHYVGHHPRYEGHWVLVK